MPGGIAMTASLRLSLAAIVLFTLVACGGSPAPDEADAEDEAAAAELGRDTDDTVLDDMVETQDRARAVEDLSLGRKDDLEQALEDSTGDSATAEEE